MLADETKSSGKGEHSRRSAEVSERSPAYCRAILPIRSTIFRSLVTLPVLISA